MSLRLLEKKLYFFLTYQVDASCGVNDLTVRDTSQSFLGVAGVWGEGLSGLKQDHTEQRSARRFCLKVKNFFFKINVSQLQLKVFQPQSQPEASHLPV